MACDPKEKYSFFFFFGKQTISLNKLSNYNRFGAHPVKIYTIQIILKNIANVHMRTYKGHKIPFLHNTHSSKQIRTLIGLMITIFKLDLLEASYQMPTIIQYGRDSIIYISIVLHDIHHGLSIQFNNKGFNV